MEEKLPKRKANRLGSYDYNTTGAYFVTICTQNRKCILSSIEQARTQHLSNSTVKGVKVLASDRNRRPSEPILTPIGKITDETICNISKIYPNVTVDHYVIMPNHVHLLLTLHSEEGGRLISAPTVNNIVRHFKRSVSKNVGYSIWQKSFFDHIIRSRDDYNATSRYICENPRNWIIDELYLE